MTVAAITRPAAEAEGARPGTDRDRRPAGRDRAPRSAAWLPASTKAAVGRAKATRRGRFGLASWAVAAETESGRPDGAAACRGATASVAKA